MKISIDTRGTVLILWFNFLLLLLSLIFYRLLYVLADFNIIYLFPSLITSLKLFLISNIPLIAFAIVFFKVWSKFRKPHKTLVISLVNASISGTFLYTWMILTSTYAPVYLLLSVISFVLSPYIVARLSKTRMRDERILDVKDKDNAPISTF